MLTLERLRELLHYNPETGIFVWKFSRRGISGGKMAGAVSVAIGYRIIRVDTTGYYAHRLAWLYMTGRWPSEVDHMDGNRENNRWSNLREATSSQNKCNAARRSDNKSGLKGVYLHSQSGSKRWRARIKLNGVITEVGLFRTKEEAFEARDAALRGVHGEFARC